MKETFFIYYFYLQMMATVILISLFQWESAIELLLQNNQFEKAALLLSSCRNFNIPINNDILLKLQLYI